jgi:hypothetical protein
MSRLLLKNYHLQIVTIPRQCDDNQDGIFTFNTANLESTLLNGKPTLQLNFDSNNNPYQVHSCHIFNDFANHKSGRDQ